MRLPSLAKSLSREKSILPIRVGYFIDCFPTTSETFVLNEIMEVAKHGFDVVIFSMGRPSVQVNHPGAQEWGLRTHYVDELLPGRQPEGLVTLKAKVKGLFQNIALRASLPPPYNWIATHAAALADDVQRADCHRIHAHFAGPASQWAFVVAGILGIPFSFTAHRYDIFDRPPERFELLIKAADLCVTVSEYNRRYLIEKYGNVAEKFKVIACGTDSQVFCPQERAARTKGQILTVGRLSPEKGYGYLLEAASILHADGVDFHWNIVGEGAERRSIERNIQQRELQNKVTLLGARPSTDVQQLMNSSELFVLSSITEGAPVVYMEAMSSATPIVGTDIMGVSEIVLDGVTGILVPPADPAALASRIHELLDDEFARTRMGLAGREHVLKNLSLQGQVEKLIQLWERDTTSITKCPVP